MVYCSHCGAQISEDALFCSKCGTRTVVGMKAGAATSSEEMREILIRMSREMENAFHLAAKNVQDAFETAKKNVHKTVTNEATVCPNCSKKNSTDATYCHKCGKKIEPSTAPTN